MTETKGHKSTNYCYNQSVKFVFFLRLISQLPAWIILRMSEKTSKYNRENQSGKLIANGQTKNFQRKASNQLKDCLNGFSEAFEYDVELEARLDEEAEKEASRGDALIGEADA